MCVTELNRNQLKQQIELHNQYGECVCVLECDEYGYYHIPNNAEILLDVGDVLAVVEVDAHKM